MGNYDFFFYKVVYLFVVIVEIDYSCVVRELIMIYWESI